MSSNESAAYEIMKSLDVDYVLIIFGGVIGYSGDDINKFLWMVRIAEGEHPKDIRVSGCTRLSLWPAAEADWLLFVWLDDHERDCWFLLLSTDVCLIFVSVLFSMIWFVKISEPESGMHVNCGRLFIYCDSNVMNHWEMSWTMRGKSHFHMMIN